MIQVDSSKHGIGVVLLQEGHPLEYASQALSPSERNWAQIEKEALSVLCGLKKFDQYMYGRPVKVENDHKPLATILRKPLNQSTQASARHHDAVSQVRHPVRICNGY